MKVSVNFRRKRRTAPRDVLALLDFLKIPREEQKRALERMKTEPTTATPPRGSAPQVEEKE